MKRILLALLFHALLISSAFANNQNRLTCADLNNTHWASERASINAAYFFCSYKADVHISVQKEKANVVMELTRTNGPKMCDEIPTLYQLEGTCKDGEMYPLIVHSNDVYIRAGGLNEGRVNFWGSMSLFDGKVQGTLQSYLHQA